MVTLSGLVYGLAAGAAFVGLTLLIDYVFAAIYWRIEKRRIVKNFKKSTYEL